MKLIPVGMKKCTVILLWSLLFIRIGSYAQNDGGVSIGKGDIPANSKAILELVSTNKGLLITRLTTDQRNAIDPDASARGLLVFDNTLNAFYFWDGYAWKAISSGNIRTVSGAPVTPGTTGELVFDVQNSLLYVYSGSSWVNIGGNSNQQTTIVKDLSLTGSGTTALPLGVAQGGITNEKIAGNAVTGDKIAFNSITGDKIANNAIIGDKIANNTITGDKITNNTIIGDKIAYNTITSEKTINGSITGDKIADKTINISKLLSGNGDQVLVTNSAGNPEWISKSSLGIGSTGSLKINETLSYDTNGKLTIAPQTAQDGYILQWDAGTPWGWKPGKITTENMKMRGDEMGEKGQVLTSYGNGEFMWKDIPTSGGIGTITDGSITTEKIADDAVTTGKIKDGTILGADLNSMGARRGEVLQWNGTIWAPDLVEISSLNVSGRGDATTFLRGDGTWGTPVGGGSAAATNITVVPSASGMTINSSTGTGATLPFASNTTSGLMSVADKIKLDGISGTGTETGTITLTGDVTGSGSGTFATTLAPVTSAKIADGAITSSKIANNAIQGNNISSMGATNGQVLQWNGSIWMPATVSGGTGGGSITLSGENYLSISGSSITANKVNLGTNVTGTLAATSLPVLTGDVTTTAGSMTTTIADGAVTTNKIANGTILAADLNQMGATNGQVLQWNNGTSSWSPATVTSGGDGDSDPGNEIELPNKTGNANKILAVNATASAVQWIDPPSGGGFPASITSPTTVTLGNNDLTFTSGAGGTGKVVAANFQTTGAVYAKVRTYSGNSNVDWQPDDYVVILTGTIPANTFALPSPGNNQFRVLCVKNNMSGTLIPLAANGSAWPTNMSNLAAGAAVMFISDGVSWNNISR